MKTDRRYLIAEIRLRLLDIKHISKALWLIHSGMNKRYALCYHAERKTVEILQLLIRELLARPSHDGRRVWVEIFKARSRSYIMVVVALYHRAAKRPYDLQALVRTSVIPHHIASAEKLVHAFAAAILKHCLESIEIGVDIAQNCYSSAHLPKQSSCNLKILDRRYLDIRTAIFHDLHLTAV